LDIETNFDFFHLDLNALFLIKEEKNPNQFSYLVNVAPHSKKNYIYSLDTKDNEEVSKVLKLI